MQLSQLFLFYKEKKLPSLININNLKVSFSNYIYTISKLILELIINVRFETHTKQQV